MSPAAIVFKQTAGDAMKFRLGTPSKEVLEHLQMHWGAGWAVDHDDFELTPSSPPLPTGVYHYRMIPRSQTKHESNAELLKKAKADFKKSWMQLWSPRTKCKMS